MLAFRQGQFCFNGTTAGGDHVLGRDSFGQHIPRDAVCGGRVEAVSAEEGTGSRFCNDASVEKQRAAISIFCAELDIVANH